MTLEIVKDLGLRFPTSTSKRRRPYAKYLCFCGKEFVANKEHVNSKRTSSCGCIRKKGNVKHGLRYSKLYSVWRSIKQRCINDNSLGYKNYGGRGIIMCKSWEKSPELFCKWAEENGYKDGLEIDRIDNNGNYEPNNCRFVTRAENNRNTRRTILNPAKVLQIKRLLILGVPNVDIARIFRVGPVNIGLIKKERIWN